MNRSWHTKYPTQVLIKGDHLQKVRMDHVLDTIEIANKMGLHENPIGLVPKRVLVLFP